MGKTVADLTLDDEHMTVGVADTLQEAAKRLLTISGGIVVVLDDDQRVKGVLGQRQLIRAMSEGVDGGAARNATNTWKWISCRLNSRIR